MQKKLAKRASELTAAPIAMVLIPNKLAGAGCSECENCLVAVRLVVKRFKSEKFSFQLALLVFYQTYNAIRYFCFEYKIGTIELAATLNGHLNSSLYASWHESCLCQFHPLGVNNAMPRTIREQSSVSSLVSLISILK